jgi:hypothetical protein
MVGSNPLWVAKQHGHSVTTMLRVYAAWTEGAIEADIKAIRRSMHAEPSPAKTSSSANSERQRISPRRAPPAPTPTQSGSCHLAVRRSGDNLSTGDAKGITGGERGRLRLTHPGIKNQLLSSPFRDQCTSFVYQVQGTESSLFIRCRAPTLTRQSHRSAEREADSHFDASKCSRARTSRAGSKVSMKAIDQFRA